MQRYFELAITVKNVPLQSSCIQWDDLWMYFIAYMSWHCYWGNQKMSSALYYVIAVFIHPHSVTHTTLTMPLCFGALYWNGAHFTTHITACTRLISSNLICFYKKVIDIAYNVGHFFLYKNNCRLCRLFCGLRKHNCFVRHENFFFLSVGGRWWNITVMGGGQCCA